MPPSIRVHRTPIVLRPDETRVVLRPLRFATKQEHTEVIRRALALPEKEAKLGAEEVLADFSARHKNLPERISKRFREVEPFLPPAGNLSEDRKLLIGSYFLFEYSAEAAALFNPSIIPHPDQSDLPRGSTRFLMSLRSTGEGHISSISFRSGFIDAQNNVAVDPPSRFLCEPELIENPVYNKELFWRKLSDLRLVSDGSREAMQGLGDSFTLEELRSKLHETLQRRAPGKKFDEDPTAEGMWHLAKSNYEIQFAGGTELSERIIFPVLAAQSNGIEDVRLTVHQEEDGRTAYYGTYTAYDGRNVLPQLFITEDFQRFKFATLNGSVIKNKGMSLFPRKVNGHYAMLSRQDGENIFLMYSDNVHFWHEAKFLLGPVHAWEILKLGNCGSPIETEAGWLVLSHGVGPMRRYCLSAFLLDRNDPSKVIGRLSKPLMTPGSAEREGYVPNVLYTCGALLRDGQLILPYGMSDRAVGFAVIALREILSAMR